MKEIQSPKNSATGWGHICDRRTTAESKIGTFSDALMAEAKKNGWTVISMKDDWKVIFPFENK